LKHAFLFGDAAKNEAVLSAVGWRSIRVRNSHLGHSTTNPAMSHPRATVDQAGSIGSPKGWINGWIAHAQSSHFRTENTAHSLEKYFPRTYEVYVCYNSKNHLNIKLRQEKSDSLWFLSPQTPACQNWNNLLDMNTSTPTIPVRQIVPRLYHGTVEESNIYG
jgi:hypothetical protein